MKKKSYLLICLVAVLLALTISSCKKDHAEKDPNAWKYEWVKGTWKQKDLQIAVTVKLGGQKIPEGTSMIQLAPLLGQALGNPAIAEAILCTKDNTYAFNADSTFTITGCTDFILPNAGNSGTWRLTVYDAVLQLTPEKGGHDPHWINSITQTTMNLALTVHIPGVGNAPLNLILEKQQ